MNRWRRLLLPAGLTALISVAGGYLFYSYDRREPARRTDAGYVDPAACAGCHRHIWETYRRTGMGRAWAVPREEAAVEDFTRSNTYYHRASDRHYTTYWKDGKVHQRRHQIGFGGQQTNVVEKEAHFVVGSGNHVRTYLHRTPQGRLVELPLGWYSAKGGYWAMNPGYDRPDHEDFRRQVTFQCLFCHNGYPQIEEGSDATGTPPIFPGSLPQGIDCQRCHGPGRAHLEASQPGKGTPEAIRRAIVNPARLTPERQLELCMQCHLESTTFPLPHAIVRYQRGMFSYRPGEALADYILHFDHPAGAGYDDKFEIAHAAYRLRMSACFQKSIGAMVCTTCHNPHDIPRGEAAMRHYTSVCQSCHGEALGKLVAAKRHPASQDCLSCHMPKRRTDDVVHAVMTDHFIQRRKPARDLLAPLAEKSTAEQTAYRGEVVLYYPPKLPENAESELYLAVAQVRQGSNLAAGIPRLEKALERHRPARGEFYFELAEACWKTGQADKALAMYQEALRRQPDFGPAAHNLGTALGKSGRLTEAAAALERALVLMRDDPTTLNDLALVYINQGNARAAAETLTKALRIDPDLPDAYNNLGGALSALGDRSGAEAAYRNAIRVQPDLAEAHKNLASLLAGRDDFAQAQHHYQKAIQSNPQYAAAYYDYGVALAQRERYRQAGEQFEAALRVDPNFAAAHNALGEMLTIQGDASRAIQAYRRAVAVRPDFAEAQFNLGTALAASGRTAEAAVHFRKAAESPDPQLRREALKSLEALGRPLP